jgi:prolyl-tRNA synthetase
MKQSVLFTKAKREAPKDEEAINVQLLIRAGFIDKLMAGVYTFLPLGLRVLKKIENIIREEIEAIGGQEILMPTLQPKNNWAQTGRWETYDSLFKFTSFYSKNEYVLGPTHEEIVSPLMKNFIFSYKDLPLYVFQIQNKFRDEKRAKSGLLRGREFLMKDLYSFHRDENDLDKYYEKVKAAYFRIFKRVGLGKLTVLTFASGGTFSKYSHEFQTLSPVGEDKIYLCEKCQVAINQEIIKEQNSCPKCGNKNLKNERAIEVGNIFKLKTKYSSPFNLKYRDEKGEEKEVIMGCYGIGLTRLMGTIVEVYHDDKGIIWPETVAPYKAHLIKLTTNNQQLTTFAEKIYHSLQKANVEILYDDRQEVSAGEKLIEADLIGIPYRLIVSEKTGKKIEIKKRNEKRIKLVGEKELVKLLNH